MFFILIYTQYKLDLTHYDIGSTEEQGYVHFSRIWEPPQNSR
jgi:hypothetical protein